MERLVVFCNNGFFTALIHIFQAQIRQVIMTLNSLDIELWEFAINLATSRSKMHKSFANYLKQSKSENSVVLAREFMINSQFSVCNWQ